MDFDRGVDGSIVAGWITTSGREPAGFIAGTGLRTDPVANPERATSNALQLRYPAQCLTVHSLDDLCRPRRECRDGQLCLAGA